jgi:hypothetical protein
VPGVIGEQRDGVDLSSVYFFQIGPDELFETAEAGHGHGAVFLARSGGSPSWRTEIEAGQPVSSLSRAGGDGVQCVLHGGGEVIVDQATEVPLQQPHHGEGHP